MSGTGANVRLVRCPKCRGILPELANVPLYKCGGCGATLRAKNRKQADQSTSSGTLDDNPAQNNELEHASQGKELTSSSQEVNMCPTEPSEQVQFEGCSKEQSGSRIVSKGISSPGELNCQEKKEHSEAEGSTEADGNNGVDYGLSSPDSQIISEGYSTTYTPHRSSDESIPSQTDNSSSNEQLEQSQEIFRRDSDHSRSRDTVETTEVTDENNIPEEDKLSGREVTDANNILEEDKFSGRLIRVSKSPTTRSSHAYDGSVSSYEGWDDQVPDQDLFKQGFFETRKVAEDFDTNGRPTMADFPVTNKMITNIDLPNQSRKFSSMSPSKKQGPVMMENNVNWDQDGLPDGTSYDIEEQEQHNFEGFQPVRNWIRSERDEVLSRKTFYRKGSSAGNKNGVPSSYGNKEFMYGSGLHSPDKIPYVERNQMELLRKVDELRDQLCRSYAQRGKTNEKFPIRGTQQDNEQAMYYNHEPPGPEVLRGYDGNHPWHLSGAYRPSKSVPFQRGSSRVPFLGKATDCRHHVDYTCLHGCPEQWQCPLQMPLPNVFCNSHQCGGINPGHICYHPCDSGPANPGRHMDSKFPFRGCNSEQLPHNQSHMDRKVEKLYHRNRRNPIKRHCRPIAGGAPFVVCTSCRKLLHLPADFSPSSRRCHKLRCGSCSEVLVFQFHNRTNVPYRPNLAVPPPSEVDNSSDATTTRILASKYHTNDFPQVEEELNSKDYRVSVLKQSRDDHESSVGGASQSVGQPLSEETKADKLLRGKEVRHSAGSPLHRLMGYSSPRQMIERPSTGLER
ncbi:Protein of unknown function DUF3133 [Macleaya cordata]|uniref:Uncharacterized protein n=1 Tax=Macleaya cordata TaxID=56857 RepID=A0A200R3L1_MACCD|nr:Protein of unknown function DUF3133 [Macleaya cordata]